VRALERQIQGLQWRAPSLFFGKSAGVCDGRTGLFRQLTCKLGFRVPIRARAERASGNDSKRDTAPYQGCRQERTDARACVQIGTCTAWFVQHVVDAYWATVAQCAADHTRANRNTLADRADYSTATSADDQMLAVFQEQDRG